MKNIIELQHITAAYEGSPVLEDINLHIPPGVLMGIIGPNGAGKSTLLKVILNLLSPLSGTLRFSIGGETDPKRARKKIAYVPQSSSVNRDFPATVSDIVLMGRYGHIGWCRRPGRRDRMIAKEMLFQVGMEEYEKRHLDELSGGQQQRVFLARALAEEAEVYLLDEPFKGVDAMTEKDILALLRKRRDRGETVIVVHHALQTVPEYFDRAVLINRRLVAEGPVKDVFTSENIEKTFFPAGEETPSWT